MPNRPFIIAANPSGDQLTYARSTALDDRAKSSNPFDETRRAILARLNGPPVHVTVDDDLDADLRIIGYGLAAAYLFVVVFRIAQVWS